MATEVSEGLRRRVAERAYHVCEYCLLHEDDSFWGCQVDHIISRKHRGRTEPSNLLADEHRAGGLAPPIFKQLPICEFRLSILH
jgi:hypothetical protein